MTMINPFEAYGLYNSLKLHFSQEGYDAVKYNFQSRVKKETFWKRRDKYFFEKVSRKYSREEAMQFYVANFVENNSSWIGNMVNDEKTYTEWQKKMQSLSYVFESDMKTCINNYDVKSLDALLKTSDGEMYPPVIQALLAEEICIESVVILDKLVNFVKDVETADTIVWPSLRMKILKYRPFVLFSKKKFTSIVLKYYNS